MSHGYARTAVRSRSPFALGLGLGLAGLALGAADAALAAPPRTSAAKSGTVAERSALANEDATQTATAADLAVPAGGDRFAGKPIVRVEAVTVGKLWRSEERLSSVKPGELYSGEAARRAVREALASGRFARAGAEVYAEGGGVVLRIALLPRRVIASLTVAGGALDRGETLDAAGLTEGGEVTAPAMELARSRIAILYANHGFPRATVNVDATDTDTPDRAVVVIEIEPGPPLLIERRIFVIDPTMVGEIGTLREKYKVSPGFNVFEEALKRLGISSKPSARADEPALAEADRDMTETLRQNGFPRAEVKHKITRKGKGAVLEVRLRSGPRVVPVFDGNRAFDSDQLMSALDLGKGDTSRPAELQDRLHDYYVKRGFLDAEISVTERGGASDPVHYLTFRVIENRRVRVTRRVFPCLTGEISPDDVGAEIQTFLEEDLPRDDGFSGGDPRALLKMFGPETGAGGRAVPLAINPAVTFAPQSYERALKHLKDLFYSKGYLNVVVGPVSVMRARCDPKKSGEQCVPEPLPRVPAICGKDELGLPLPEPKLPVTLRCEPDPAHGVECAPEVTVVLPIHPGPRSLLYDIAFEGNRNVSDQRLAGIVDLSIGEPVSSLDVEAARLRLIDSYQARGYAYADVKASIDPSPDRTRARAKFTIAEHDVVKVTGFVVKGATRTDEKLILSRVALVAGDPYRQDLARTSEERIAALGTFSTVSLSLEDPDVPQRNKRVVVTVVEQLPQYLDPRIGFSTGEGFRLAFEYGNRNLFGHAVSLLFRVQLSYLPDVLILDKELRATYAADPPLNPKAPLNNIGYRLERRIAASLSFPDIGLGPNVSLSLDGADIHDLQRDYGLTKDFISPTVSYRRAWRDPRAKTAKQISLQGSLSGELNDVQLLREEAAAATTGFLRVPVGQSLAFAQKVNATFDGRNNPFAATTGILAAASVEHVNAVSIDNPIYIEVPNVGPVPVERPSHFLKVTGKVTGYVPLGADGFSLAMSLSGGGNIQLQSGSETYPDRLFFMGGGDTLRSYLADKVVPQDLADCIGENLDKVTLIKRGCTDKSGHPVSLKYEDIVINGGDLELNPRIELRFPLKIWSLLQGGLFLDAGNLWKDPKKADLLNLRFAGGLGLRVVTPIGPLALDYGINLGNVRTGLRRYKWEDFGAFHFSIGLF